MSSKPPRSRPRHFLCKALYSKSELKRNLAPVPDEVYDYILFVNIQASPKSCIMEKSQLLEFRLSSRIVSPFHFRRFQLKDEISRIFIFGHQIVKMPLKNSNCVSKLLDAGKSVKVFHTEAFI